MAKHLAKDAGKAAVAQLGWWKAHRFLILRRLTQLSVLLAFWSGPFWDVWLFKGNLSGSVLFDVVPFTDPLIAAQTLASGHWLQLQPDWSGGGGWLICTDCPARVLQLGLPDEHGHRSGCLASSQTGHESEL